MAVLAALVTGSFTSAGTWEVVDATSYLNSETGSDVLTTAYSGTRSSAFTPGAITIDAIAVKLSVRTGTTGTISVNLELDSGDTQVAGTEVTINTADLPAAATADANGGWILFKLAAPVLLVAATAYQVAAKTSSATQVSLFRDGTTDNISRFLRTTTTQAPAAGDDLIICGEKTGAGAETAIVVTMNNTATTDFGAASTSLVLPALAICDGGTLTYGTGAATAYYLKLSGNAIVYSDGILNIGTTGTPIPRGSSAVLELDPAADGDMGLLIRNGGTANIQGLSRTVAKLVFSCKLNTDEAAAQTVLGVDTDTGWLTGDEIAIASTTRTAAESEKRTLDAGTTSTTVTVTAGLTNAHSGTSPTQAEVILLTRNVKVRSATSTVMAYVWCGPTSTVDIDWAEFYYLGDNVATKRGIEVATTTGSFDMQNCSVHDCEDGGVWFSTTSGSCVFSSNVGWALDTAAASATASLLVTATSGAHTIDGNIFVGCNGASNGAVMAIGDLGTTVTNNVIAGGTANRGMEIGEASSSATPVDASGNTIHSCSSNGFSSSNLTNHRLILSNLTVWRNTLNGVSIGSIGVTLLATGLVAFGNGNGVAISVATIATLRTPVLNGGVTLVQAAGLLPSGGGEIYVLDGSFGVTTAHSAGDINYTAAGTSGRVHLWNTTLTSSTEVANQGFMTIDWSFVKSTKHDASGTTHKSWYRAGTIESDQTTRHTASGYSWKMTSINTLLKLRLIGPSEFDTFKTAVAASADVTITAWCYKDATFNGNAPRLVVVGGIVDGVGSAGTDVTDALTVAHSTWEQLSVAVTPNEAGVIEVYGDSDGTAGSCYFDDFTVTQA